MRVIAACFGPYAPDTLTSHVSVFSHHFKGFERLTKLATSSLYAALIFLSVLSFKTALIPLVVWAMGQGLLVLLTQWDLHWDDIGIAQLTRRYRDHYGAG